MALIVDSITKVFDTAQIKKGYLMYAKHRSWPDGRGGFVTAVTDKQITVQYHPGIANVTNHFFLQADEVAAGEWEVRWSADMIEVHEYRSGGGVGDDVGGVSS